MRIFEILTPLPPYNYQIRKSWAHLHAVISVLGSFDASCRRVIVGHGSFGVVYALQSPILEVLSPPYDRHATILEVLSPLAACNRRSRKFYRHLHSAIDDFGSFIAILRPTSGDFGSFVAICTLQLTLKLPWSPFAERHPPFTDQKSPIARRQRVTFSRD